MTFNRFLNDKKEKWQGVDIYWFNYWHDLINKDMSGFASNTLLIRIQYCYQFI